MLKRRVNECRFTLNLETKCPFLIKEGRLASDEEQDKDWKEKLGIRDEEKKNYPNAIFVSLNPWDDILEAIKDKKGKDYSKLKFYIPGSSLRGVMRSHAEKIVRTLWDNAQNPICCDPFDRSENSAETSCSALIDSAKRKNWLSNKDSYKYSCSICRLFGNTHTASRIHVHDSSIVTGIRELNVRDGIGIDRFTGGVSSGANFQNHILENRTFQSLITIRNFELWQLGLLAYVLRDFERELVTLGFGKNKGFGRVKGTLNKVELVYYGESPNQHQGLGELCPNDTSVYDFISIPSEPSELKVDLDAPTKEDLYWKLYEIDVAQNNGGMVGNEFWKSCAKVWNKAVEQKRFKTIPELKEMAKPNQDTNSTQSVNAVEESDG